MAKPERQASLNQTAKKYAREPSGDPVIGSRLRAEMKKHRVSGAELARQLGVSKSAISQWLNGQTAIDPRHLATISTLVRLPISDLYILPAGAEFLTAQERQLLHEFRSRLDDETRESLLVLLKSR